MARRSPEIIEQDQGDILNRVAMIGQHRAAKGRSQAVSEVELRPQRAPAPSPIPPGYGEKHPRRTDLQALVKQGKLETNVRADLSTHATSNVGGNYITATHTRAYYNVSPAQFAWMQHPEYVPGIHEPVRDQWDAGETDEDMRKDRQQRAEGTRLAGEHSTRVITAAFAQRRQIRRAT